MKPTERNMVATMIKARHTEDLAVPQCRYGRSDAAVGIIDLWTMKKSWAKFTTTAYEVKVSRADFLGDDKWQHYLPYCHQFYFAVPPKMVRPEEIPNPAGLIYVNVETGSARIAKKAASRQPESQYMAELYKYVLMWRTKIDAPRHDFSTRQTMRQYLESKYEDALLGTQVARRIRDDFAKQKARNDELQQKIGSLEEVRKFWTEALGCKEEELIRVYKMQIDNRNRNLLDRLTKLPDHLRELKYRSEQHARESSRLAEYLSDVLKKHETTEQEGLINQPTAKRGADE